MIDGLHYYIPTDSNLDIAFIVSDCQTTAKDSFQQQLDFVSDLHKSLALAPDKNRVAIISVANGAQILQPLTSAPSDPSAVLSAYINQPTADCTFGKGLETAHSIFEATGVRGVLQILVVLLAGKSIDDISKPSQNLHEAGVLVYTVDLSNTLQPTRKSDVIKMVVTDPASEFFISTPGFPISESTRKALLEKLTSGMSSKCLFKSTFLILSASFSCSSCCLILFCDNFKNVFSLRVRGCVAVFIHEKGN